MKKGLVTLLFTAILLGCSSNSNVTSTSHISSTNNKISSVEEKEYKFNTYYNGDLPLNNSGQLYKGEIADPSVVKGDDGKFYVFSTLRKVFVSDDMCNWELLTENIISRPTWADGDYYGRPDVWAPDCIKIKDKWIYYYSLAAWDMPSAGIGYAVSDNIYGPYVDKGLLFNEEDINMNGLIDPQPFIDDDGKIYMIVGSFHGNYLVELSSDGMGLMNGKEFQSQNKTLIAGVPLDYFNNTYYEGCYITKKDNYYYLFGSAGSCCAGASSSYRVVVGRADNIAGPYYTSDGVNMAQSNGGTTIGDLCLWSPTIDKTTAGPGHNSILIDDAGDYWMIYHSYCDVDDFATRHMFIDKLSWNEKGFPYVSYTYENDNREEKTINYKPSYQIELDGPRFLEGD